MGELLTPRVGLAGQLQQKDKGQEVCLEISGKFAVVFFKFSLFSMYDLFSHFP